MARTWVRSRGRRGLSFRRAGRNRFSRTFPINRQSIRIRAPRAEVKSHSLGAAVPVLVASAGQVVPLTLMAEGTSDWTREGNVVRMLGSQIRVNVAPATDSVANIVCRVIVFEWTQGYSSPAVGSIIDVSTGGFLYGPYDQENARNYRILYDRVHQVPQVYKGTSGTYGAVPKFFTIRPSIKGIVNFNGTGGDQSNRRFFILFGTDSQGDTDCNIQWMAQHKFCDL